MGEKINAQIGGQEDYVKTVCGCVTISFIYDFKVSIYIIILFICLHIIKTKNLASTAYN